MSTDAHAAAAHGHHASPDHHPHVAPLSMYFGVWATLVFFTVLTVVVSRFDFGSANLLIALAIAAIKGSLVALFFMHLYWDHKFNAVIFVSSLIFLTIFISFTSFDTFHRGNADYVENNRPATSTDPFGGVKPREDVSFDEGRMHAMGGDEGGAAGAEGAEAPAAPGAK